MTKVKNKAWILISDGFILCMNRKGEETWTPESRNKMPNGVCCFDSEGQALGELYGMKTLGNWPLYVDEAKAVEKEWTTYED